MCVDVGNMNCQGSFRSVGGGGGGSTGGSSGYLTMGTPGNNGHGHHSLGAVPDDLAASNWSLAVSPPPSDEARHALVRPRNIVEKARLNVA